MLQSSHHARPHCSQAGNPCLSSLVSSLKKTYSKQAWQLGYATTSAKAMPAGKYQQLMGALYAEVGVFHARKRLQPGGWLLAVGFCSWGAGWFISATAWLAELILFTMPLLQAGLGPLAALLVDLPAGKQAVQWTLPGEEEGDPERLVEHPLSGSGRINFGRLHTTILKHFARTLIRNLRERFPRPDLFDAFRVFDLKTIPTGPARKGYGRPDVRTLLHHFCQPLTCEVRCYP